MGMTLFAHFPLPTLHSPFPEICRRGSAERRRFLSIALQFTLLLSIISNIADDIAGDARSTSPSRGNFHAGTYSGILPRGDKRRDARGNKAAPAGHNGDDVPARRPME
jgi:hypothetical protein